MNIQHMASDLDLFSRVSAFLGHEAKLLDDRDWHEWLDLYAEKTRFWAPVWNGDDQMTADPQTQLNLIWADRIELESRIYRIESDDSYASMPLPHTVHLVTCTGAERGADGTIAATANWIVRCFWRAYGEVSRAGRYEYRIDDSDGEMKIAQKKVLVFDDRVLGAIDLYSI